MGTLSVVTNLEALNHNIIVVAAGISAVVQLVQRETGILDSNQHLSIRTLPACIGLLRLNLIAAIFIINIVQYGEWKN